MKISLLYATRGRPDQCLNQLVDWTTDNLNKFKQHCELILCIGSDQKEEYKKVIHGNFLENKGITVIYNDRPRMEVVNYDELASKYSTAITSWNDCAARCSGEWLVTIADDLKPFPDWIDKYLEFLGKFKSEDEIVFCPPNDNARGLISHPIMSRALYTKLGNILSPKYIHSYCDNDIWMVAKVHGWFREIPQEMFFEHFNPLLNDKAKLDQTYREAYSKRNNDHGKKVFERESLDLSRRIGHEKFIQLTDGKIKVREQSEKITKRIEELVSRVNKFPYSIIVGQPKRKKDGPVIQIFEDNRHVVLPFGLRLQYASVHGLLVDEARNKLIEHAIKENAKYLIFVDDDIALPRDGLGMFIQTAERFNGDAVIGGVATIKGTSTPAISTVDKEGRLITPDCSPKFEPIQITWATGCACLLIPVNILKEMKVKEPDIPWCWIGMKDGKQECGEDIFLCDGIQRAGYKIYIDTRIQCLHFNMETGDYYSYIPVDESKYFTTLKKIKRING